MKALKIVFVMFVGFFTSTLIAQETTWFDANWKETTKEKGEFYRPAPQKKDNGFWIVDYYKDGTKQMEGFSAVSTASEEVFDGVVMYYHANGKPFHKANYKKGQLDGKRDVFYESGNLKEQGRYKDGKRNGIWKTFYESGKIETKGKYKEGEKVGIWKTFYKNG